MKAKYILKAVLCVALCLCMIMSIIPASAETPKEYVKEVKMVSIDEDTEKARKQAIKELTDKGYKVQYKNWGNLNAGADGGCCYIGYKTTTDPDEAITDMRVIEMNGGYAKSNYDGLTDATRQSFGRIWKGIAAAMNEIRSNFEKGSPAAQYAIDQLDHFTVDSLADMKLGQAILQGRIDKDIFQNMFYYCSGRTLSTIYNNMLTGCADYGDSTWADRAAEVPYDKPYSAAMYTEAEYFVNSIENTGIKAHVALEHMETLMLEKYTDDELWDDDIYDQAVAECFPQLSAEDRFYWMVYQTLEEYSVQIADYATDEYGNLIMDKNGQYVATATPFPMGDAIWGWDEATRFEPEWCYPLYLGMTEGQRALIPFCGIEIFVGSICNDAETFQKVQDTSAQLGKTVHENETLSIYWDMDPTLVKETVYMTDRAARSLANQGSISALTRYQERDRFLHDMMQWNAIGFGVVAVFDLVFAIGSLIFKTTFGGVAAIGAVWSAITAGTAVTLATTVAAFASLLNIGLMLVMVALAFAWLIVKIIEWCQSVEYTKMPRIMYDARESETERQDFFVRYDLVTDPSGNEADLNGFVSDKWLAVYTTKDPQAGTPILADGNMTFIRQEGSGAAPAGYTPLRMFGGRTAVNTNLYSDDDDRGGLYLFYRNAGGPPVYNDNDGPYLRSMKVVHGDNEALLMAKIETSEENNVFLHNLTPGNGYTYLTYSTTPDAYDAIRDIRITEGIHPRNEDGGFYIGSASYSNAGTVGNVSYLTTKKTQMGDPIFADSFLATDTVMTERSLYIPVCLAAGGPAADLNCEMQYEGSEQEKHVYLYFKSDREEPEDGTLYLSGIAEITMTEVTQSSDPGWTFEDIRNYAIKRGYVPIEGTETVEHEDTIFENFNTLSCYGYTTTSYYKRALGDIVIVDNEKVKMTPIVQRANGVYMSIPSPAYYLYDGLRLHLWNCEPNDYPYFVGNHSNLQKSISNVVEEINGPGMYVVPATSKDTAIKIDGFTFVKANSAAYFDIANKVFDYTGLTYAVDALNVKVAGKLDGQFYVRFNGKAPEVGQYISGVSVSDVSAKEGTSDTAYAGLISQGADTYLGAYSMRGGDLANTGKYYYHVGLRKTNDSRKAVTDIKIISYPAGQEPKEEIITSSGIKYTLSSNNSICYLDDDKTKVQDLEWRMGISGPTAAQKQSFVAWSAAYVYTTTNPMAGSVITDFYFSERPLMNGAEYVEFERYSSTMTVAPFLSSILGHSFEKVDILKDAHDILDGAPKVYFYVEREAPNKYISEIGVVYYTFGNVDSGDYEDIVNDPHTLYHTNVIDKDLNSRAGGKYMNLTYKRTNDSSKAITGLIAVVGKNAPSYFYKGSICYYMVNAGDCPDLNKGAGGEYIYLYYTKDPAAGDPMTELNVVITKTSAEARLSDGYKWVYDANRKRIDFNDDAGGDFVFIEYKTERVPAKAGLASFFGEGSVTGYVVIGSAFILIAGAFVFGIVRIRHLKKKVEATVSDTAETVG